MENGIVSVPAGKGPPANSPFNRISVGSARLMFTTWPSIRANAPPPSGTGGANPRARSHGVPSGLERCRKLTAFTHFMIGFTGGCGVSAVDVDGGVRLIDLPERLQGRVADPDDRDEFVVGEVRRRGGGAGEVAERRPAVAARRRGLAVERDPEGDVGADRPELNDQILPEGCVVSERRLQDEVLPGCRRIRIPGVAARGNRPRAAEHDDRSRREVGCERRAVSGRDRVVVERAPHRDLDVVGPAGPGRGRDTRPDRELGDADRVLHDELAGVIHPMPLLGRGRVERELRAGIGVRVEVAVRQRLVGRLSGPDACHAGHEGQDRCARHGIRTTAGCAWNATPRPLPRLFRCPARAGGGSPCRQRRRAAVGPTASPAARLGPTWDSASARNAGENPILPGFSEG